MTIDMIVHTHSNVIVLRKNEYDLYREKADILNEVFAIQRKKIRGDYKYDWDYVAALSHLLDDMIEADEPEAMAEAKNE